MGDNKLTQFGILTFAHVDCPDDIWRWAVVMGYRDDQDYDRILMAFAEGFEPLPSDLRVILMWLNDLYR